MRNPLLLTDLCTTSISQSYTLLSTENFSVTSTEIRRLLQNYGVRVLIEDSESYGTLKCTVGEVRGERPSILPTSIGKWEDSLF